MALKPGIVVVNGRKVLVHVPKGGSKRTRIVLYFHGFGQTVEGLQALMVAFDRAKTPAILIAPQLGPKSEPGDLAIAGGVAALLRGLGLAPASIDVVAHSGGYTAAAAAIALGGVPVASVGLLDALYGKLEVFLEFVKKPSTRHFINVYGPTTADLSVALANDAKTAGVPSKLVTLPSPSATSLALGAHKMVTEATLVVHVSVPETYGAAMIDAMG